MSVLSKLVVEVKEAWVSYPGIAGFELLLAHQSRPALIKMRKDSMYSKINRKTRMPEEHFDEDAFVEKFAKAVIKDWKGLTLGKLEELLPLGEIADPAQEVPYSQEDALVLLKNSGEFDTWVNEVIFDLQNFRSERD